MWQALYFCVPFREQLLEYAGNKFPGDAAEEENLLTCLAELFSQVVCLLGYKICVTFSRAQLYYSLMLVNVIRLFVIITVFS